MLRASQLVVLSKHVRSLLVHDDRVSRPTSANGNEDNVEHSHTIDDDGVFVPQEQPLFNALSSGHGSGF